MAYLDYVGLAYFKSLLDENYLRTDYEGDTIINGNVTFTEPVDASVKNDWLGHQIDKTYIKDVTPDPEGSGALALILGDGTVSHLVTDTTVTQVRSNANELYPILLCHDASAEEDQIAKKVWYGNGVRINPRYGYLYSQKMFTLHSSYNRASAPTSRVEWTNDFRDSVLNPVGQIFEYIDPVSSGGEHRMEFRLYGNPNVAGINTPNVNDETNTISMGVSATRGDTLTFFGYCPSTPIYLENGSTMRKSLTRGDQYGRDIITRDWLNLNGSITGLVHTYMDETIDGSKTFKKTVTINSGDNNNKAGLTVQGNASIGGNSTVAGNSSISGNETVGGTLTTTGKFTANGTAEIKGGSGNTPSLTVTGNEKVTGNSTVDGNSNVGGNSTITGSETVGGNISTTNGNISTTNGTISGKTGSIGSGGLTVAGNETVTGKITGNGGAEISGGNGLKVNGNETVTGNISAAGNIATNGTITKVVNNTPVEYVTYVTNQPEVREALSENILALGKGLNKDSTGKIYVDFSQIDDNVKANILAGLNMQIPLKNSINLYVNPGASNDTDDQDLQFNTRIATPFTTIQAAIDWASSKLALGSNNVAIRISAGTYHENVVLKPTNTGGGTILLTSVSGEKDVIIEPIAGSTGYLGHCIFAGSGACNYTVSHLVCKMNLSTNCQETGVASIGIGAHTDGAVVRIQGCDVIAKLADQNATVTGNPYTIRMINAELGGTIEFYPDDKGSYLEFYLPTNDNTNVNHNGIQIDVLNVSRRGTLTLITSPRSTNGEVVCKGTCSNFCHVWQGGSVNRAGGSGAELHFVVADNATVTGTRYSVSLGSFIYGPSTGLPGQVDSVNGIDTSTYCWVRPLSMTEN